MKGSDMTDNSIRILADKLKTATEGCKEYVDQIGEALRDADVPTYEAVPDDLEQFVIGLRDFAERAEDAARKWSDSVGNPDEEGQEGNEDEEEEAMAVVTDDLNVNHRLTFARGNVFQRKEVCATVEELERVITYAIKWKVDTWDDYTSSMVRRIEFGGEALEAVMKAGLESLARKKLRRDPGSKDMTLLAHPRAPLGGA
jgi:hypothetical protein